MKLAIEKEFGFQDLSLEMFHCTKHVENIEFQFKKETKPIPVWTCITVIYGYL